MGRIVIMEEKADKMVDKLEKIKDCIEDVMECFTDSMEGHRYDDEEGWDDEYEVKRRRGSRMGMRRGMRRGMREDGGDSRY